MAPGCFNMAGAIVSTEAQLDMSVNHNCAAVVDHRVQAQNFAYFGVNACTAGGSSLGLRILGVSAKRIVCCGTKVPD